MAQVSKKVVVVGGGLGGLFTGALLARSGADVEILESASRLGGRARTEDHEGFKMNLGPHALYAKGAARLLLDELGVSYTGHAPAEKGLQVVDAGRLHLFPAGPLTLMKTTLLSFREKLETGKLLAALPKADTEAWRGRTVRQWVNEQTESPRLRRFLEALGRLSTYSNDLDQQDAGAFLAQLKLALEANVLYVDGGWQVLVEGLAELAESHGAAVRAGVRVAKLVGEREISGVETQEGELIASDDVVLAVDPATCARLVDDRSPGLEKSLAGLRPVRAACLDLALSALPRPDRPFGLGLDEPYYLSVHSATAALAPPGGALIHVARYLTPGDDSDRDGREAQLEAFTDLVQPGWRDHVVHRQLMPAMTVTQTGFLHDRPRPSPRVPDVEGLWLAGDWIGDEGLLADAAANSARAVASQLAPAVAKVA